MGVQSEIQRLTNNVSAAYTAIEGKGGTLPSSLTSDNLASAIETITGGGGGDDFLDNRTMDEIYEQERPSDWPVLPDPDDEYPVYYLAFNTNTAKQLIQPPAQKGTTLEWGYIENGMFISVYTYTLTSAYTAWTYFGASISDDDWSKMSSYQVIRTNTIPNPDSTSSSSQSTSVAKNILEIKTLASSFENVFSVTPTASSGSTYVHCYTNLRFVKIYGATPTSISLGYAFYNCRSLQAIIFDKEENNFFLNDTITSLLYTFYNCRNLKNISIYTSKITTSAVIKYTFYNNYNLENVKLEFPELVTYASGDYVLCYSTVKIFIFKAPKYQAPLWVAITNNTTRAFKVYLEVFGNGNSTSISTVQNLQMYVGKSCSLTLSGNTSSIIGIQSCIFLPNSVPINLTIQEYAYMGILDIKEMFESLPNTNGTTYTITFAKISDIPDSIVKIATDKGYTVTFTTYTGTGS
jgi:hypothetical protein